MLFSFVEVGVTALCSGRTVGHGLKSDSSTISLRDVDRILTGFLIVFSRASDEGWRPP